MYWRDFTLTQMSPTGHFDKQSPPQHQRQYWPSCKVFVISCFRQHCVCPNLNPTLKLRGCVSSRWMEKQHFLLETMVAKLLNKHATGLYSMPRLLQQAPLPPAISCWCSALFHSGWIGPIVYKDWHVKHFTPKLWNYHKMNQKEYLSFPTCALLYCNILLPVLWKLTLVLPSIQSMAINNLQYEFALCQYRYRISMHDSESEPVCERTVSVSVQLCVLPCVSE